MYSLEGNNYMTILRQLHSAPCWWVVLWPRTRASYTMVQDEGQGIQPGLARFVVKVTVINDLRWLNVGHPGFATFNAGSHYLMFIVLLLITWIWHVMKDVCNCSFLPRGQHLQKCLTPRISFHSVWQFHHKVQWLHVVFYSEKQIC